MNLLCFCENMIQSHTKKVNKNHNKHHKKLGVIGGLGPETCFAFCLNVNNAFREATDQQAHIVVENLPVPTALLTKITRGKSAPEMRLLLSKAVQDLNAVHVDMIAVPCNTVHVFIEELQAASKAPLLNILEECAKECKRKGFRRVGLLASSTTVTNDLYGIALRHHGIDLVLPDTDEQKRIDTCIISIIHNKKSDVTARLLWIMKHLKEKGSQGIILGCTDLRVVLTEQVLSETVSRLPIVDSTSVLERVCVERLHARNI